MAMRKLEIDNYELFREWRSGTPFSQLARKHGICWRTVRNRIRAVQAELEARESKREAVIDAVTDHFLALLRDDRILPGD